MKYIQDHDLETGNVSQPARAVGIEIILSLISVWVAVTSQPARAVGIEIKARWAAPSTARSQPARAVGIEISKACTCP